MNNEWKFIDGYSNHYKINKDGVIVSVVKNTALQQIKEFEKDDKIPE